MTSRPAPTRAPIETSFSENDITANTTAAMPPMMTAQARAFAASRLPSGTGTVRRIQKARRSACMCVSGPMVAMYMASEYAKHEIRPRLAVVQPQPAAPKICTPMKISGIAISASSWERSRTIRRRSLVAAVGKRDVSPGARAASAQTAPASSQPAIPARRATVTASQIVPATAMTSDSSIAAACPGSTARQRRERRAHQHAGREQQNGPDGPHLGRERGGRPHHPGAQHPDCRKR